MTYFKSIRRNLLEVLRDCGCEDAVRQQRGLIGIVHDQVKCDYYDWLNGSAEGIKFLSRRVHAAVPVGQEFRSRSD